jgi:transmembrane sensor
MNNNKNISDQENPEYIDFFKKVEVPFTKSKEEVWDTLSEKIGKDDFVQPKGKLISMVWYKVAAAVVIILVGSTSFMKLYTTTIFSEKGNHANHILPDGSSVELNAVSSISYHPYWWKITREVSLEGEAFFEVEKGSNFSVTSKLGKTEVLGTSFNIFARNHEYKVFCETGKVRVSNNSSTVELVIVPGQMAILDQNNNTGKIEKKLLDNITSWRLNEFYFKAIPLTEVINEIEIQYNVSITLDVDDSDSLTYSGRFTKKGTADVTLALICQSFNLNFTSKGKNNYNISMNN